MSLENILKDLKSNLEREGFYGEIIYDLKADPCTHETLACMSYVEEGRNPLRLMATWTMELANEIKSFAVSLEKETVSAMSSRILDELRAAKQ